MSVEQESFVRDTTAEVARELGDRAEPSPKPCVTPGCKNVSNADESGGFIQLCQSCVDDLRDQMAEEFLNNQSSDSAVIVGASDDTGADDGADLNNKARFERGVGEATFDAVDNGVLDGDDSFESGDNDTGGNSRMLACCT